MNGSIYVSRDATEEVGEIIKALSLHYDIYIAQSERDVIRIQYSTAENGGDEEE